MKGASIILLLLAASLVGCVPSPTQPTSTTAFDEQGGGVWVLCEGLWRQNDAQLWHINESGNDGGTVGDVVAMVNGDDRLGDTATDIVAKGDTLFVAVSGSRRIDVIHRRTGKRIARIRFDGSVEPYRLVMANDTTLYCTNLNDDSVSEIDARTFTIRLARIPVGPAPEGIAAGTSLLAVANSGLGDLRRREPGAGTVQILRRTDMVVLHTIDGLPNVADVHIDEVRQRLWVSYRHYPSLVDSMGGLAVYDLRTYRELMRLPFRAPRSLVLQPATGDVYVLHADGIDAIRAMQPQPIVRHRSAGDSVWYSLGLHPRSGNLWIGNARSYLIPGEVIVMRTDGTVVQRRDVGRNPTAFVFP